MRAATKKFLWALEEYFNAIMDSFLGIFGWVAKKKISIPGVGPIQNPMAAMQPNSTVSTTNPSASDSPSVSWTVATPQLIPSTQTIAAMEAPLQTQEPVMSWMSSDDSQVQPAVEESMMAAALQPEITEWEVSMTTEMPPMSENNEVTPPMNQEAKEVVAPV